MQPNTIPPPLNTKKLHDILITFPPDTLEFVQKVYSQSEHILEYGSGGSTALALNGGAKRVVAVESDQNWALEMNKILSEHYDTDRFLIHHANIGPTRSWGFPENSRYHRKFHRYPNEIWDRMGDWHPDTVMIDGRFRKACFITTMLQIKRPVNVLFDDYVNRPKYREVEAYSKPVEIVGRMARFELEPREFPVAHLTQLIAAYAQAT
ncbi:MAG: hypothetical protein AAF429_05170 [Pseudomonadota bacterium]